ncbi:helicase-exonuclease AddAB subunit AddA [Lapidilactobacillus bayanensis]|uniref:helicase-exonuclease AddAB subunit AddA n=1 Tax=Lapidilactobacillus bayanensis TaxID=2485998 RepID=UPI000F79061B|nr:helicase-exonuclease AddAB subunit AddA [Lapidilactobacillus bayanensis]
MPKFTVQQQAAIDHQGHDILVSASAGSGKTTVLVKRIIEEVLHGVPLDQLLVVTFTDAATAEMRERIRQALNDAVDQAPTTTKKQALRQQLNLLNTAQISTLHSFCLKVIQKFYYLLDLDPNFRLLADETEKELIKEQTWASVRDQHYDQEDEDFFQLAEQFGNDRSDQGLADAVFELYEFAIARPQPLAWLDNVAQSYQTGASISDSPYFQTKIRPVLLDSIQELATAFTSLLAQVVTITDDKGALTDLFTADQELLQKIVTTSRAALDYRTLATQLQQIQFPARFTVKAKKYAEELAARQNFKQQLDNVKESYQTLCDQYFFAPEATLLQSQQAASNVLHNLVAVTKEFIKAYHDEKQRLKALDFSDWEQLTWALLMFEKDGQQPVQTYYRQLLHEVLVDEYQDINPLQEAILQAVSQDEPGNLFMVGDVKQSIYGFRQADPSKFLQKYQEFKADDVTGERIILAENFRSTANINQSTNFLFQQFMHHDLAELDYDQDAQLVTGAQDYPADLETTTEILLYETKPTTTQAADAQQTSSETADVETTSALTKDEARIQLLSQKIKQLLADPYQIYDRKAETTRAITYSDIAILVPTRHDNLAIVSELQTQGIPVFVKDANDYFQTTEIQVMLAFLEIINNPEQDIALVTVLRSPIGNFNENDLAAIRGTNKSSNFYHALQTAAQTTTNELSPRLQNFLHLLNHLRDFAVQHSIADLVWEIYQQTGYLDYVGGMPGGLQRAMNLHALYQRAFSYEQTSFKGLYQFINFIKQMQAHEKDLAQAQVGESDQDAVQLMTIHGSKGLEFPVVFIFNLDHQFNQSDVRRNKVVLDGKYGAGIKYVDLAQRVKYPTLIDNFIRQQHQQAAIAEEMRLLYVAMTRAKQKLIMIGATDSWEKICQTYQVTDDHLRPLLPTNLRLPSKLQNFFQLIMPAVLRAKTLQVRGSNSQPASSLLPTTAQFVIELFNQANLSKAVVPATNPETVGAVEVPFTKLDQKLQATIETLLNFQYPHQTATQTTAYQSVSEIKQAFTDPDQFQLSFLPLTLSATTGQQTATNLLPPTDLGGRLVSDDFPKPNFMTQQQKVTGAQVGTATHLMLQRVELQRLIDLDYLVALRQRLTDQQLILPEVAARINLPGIVDFFQTPLGQSLQDQQNRVQREVAFSLLLPAQAIFKMPDETEIQNLLVHGIMDGYVINDDQVTLFDYKTDYAGHGPQQQNRLDELTTKYRGQLNLYEQALSNMLQRPVDHKYLYFLNAGKIVEL